MSKTTVKTPINLDFERDEKPVPPKKGETVSLYSNHLLPANANDQKSHRKGVPGGDWNQENDVRFAKIAKISAEIHSDKLFTLEEISNNGFKHEEKLVMELIQPGGARSRPADQVLQDFARACEFIEPPVIGSLLINTLRDPQVSANFKTKAVYGMDTLIRSSNKYRRYFQANCAALNEAMNLACNETVVKNLISAVVESIQSGKPAKELLKRSQTTAIISPKPDVDLISFDENTPVDQSTKSRFAFIRSPDKSNSITPLNAATPVNGSGVLDLMSLNTSMVAQTPERSDGWKGQLDALPSALLSLYQQQELQQPKGGRVVAEIPPLHTMHAFLWDDVQSMQAHQLENSSGVKSGSTKAMDEREKAFDFIKF